MRTDLTYYSSVMRYDPLQFLVVNEKLSKKQSPLLLLLRLTILAIKPPLSRSDKLCLQYRNPADYARRTERMPNILVELCCSKSKTITHLNMPSHNDSSGANAVVCLFAFKLLPLQCCWLASLPLFVCLWHFVW